MDGRKKYQSVDEYMKDFSGVTAQRLTSLRRIIKEEVPEGAKEAISYNIPCFKLDGSVVYFSGYERHVSIYPAFEPSADTKADWDKYHSGKSTLKFPNSEPLPEDFIRRAVRSLFQA